MERVNLANILRSMAADTIRLAMRWNGTDVEEEITVAYKALIAAADKADPMEVE